MRHEQAPFVLQYKSTSWAAIPRASARAADRQEPKPREFSGLSRFTSLPGTSLTPLASDIGTGNCPIGASERREHLNIYVGNLSYDTSESDLQAAFATYGAVSTARIATDRDTENP